MHLLLHKAGFSLRGRFRIHEPHRYGGPLIEGLLYVRNKTHFFLFTYEQNISIFSAACSEKKNNLKNVSNGRNCKSKSPGHCQHLNL